MNDSIAAFRIQLRSAAQRRARTHRRRRRLSLVALTVVAAAVCTGITVAATGFFRSSPAPPEVVQDFQSYTPQLGFHPRSGQAQLVARDGEDFLLYATRNQEGTYCIVTSAPWKRPGTLNDGGTCVLQRDAHQPIAVGISAAGRVGDDGMSTLVVTGRVLAKGAWAIQFTSADGGMIERPLGAGGFFIAAVDTEVCPESDWEPTFVALDQSGDEVARASILLVGLRGPREPGAPPVCGFGVAPHGPQR